MKILLHFLILLFSALSITAQEKNFGVGIILGEPAGISAKYWMDENHAFDAALGYSFLNDNKSLALHADYLYHLNGVINTHYKMPIYYGFGIRFRARENKSNAFGVRGVVGLIVYLKEVPVDVFLETAPSFRLLPNTQLDFDIGFGARYYFNYLY